jgi:uncharacterized membrane protein YidH (DUF202 family)
MTGPPDDEEPHGAQVERTALAWNRVGLAVVANGALLVHMGLEDHLGWVEAVGLAAVAIGGAVWTLALWRYSALAHHRVPNLFANQPQTVRAVSLLVLVLSLLNLAVVLAAR